jgi:hypothetical protein
MAKQDDLKGAIRVRESVYRAAEALDDLTGGAGFRAAEALFWCFKDDQDGKQAELWRDAFEYEKSCMAADKGTLIVILPD